MGRIKPEVWAALRTEVNPEKIRCATFEMVEPMASLLIITAATVANKIMRE